MMGNEGISVADALALRNGDGGMFGGDGAWWIVILALLFGWGGRGFGGFGGFGGGGYASYGAPATQADLSAAFASNTTLRGIDEIQGALCQGFNGVNTAILQNSYNNQAGFNALTNQLASCCCDIERGQDAIKFQLEKATNQLAITNERNTDRILNYLNQTEMDKLRTELQSAQFQLSQLSQTDNIINRLMPVAKPAYLTCSPYASAFGIGLNGYGYGNFGYNSGCGCGC